MMTPDTQRHRLRGIAVAAVVATAILVPASATLAMDAAAVEAEPGDIEVAHSSVTELRSLVDDLNVTNDKLRADNSALQLNVESLSLERDRLSDSLSFFDSLYDPLEADRLLLFELRKGLPETRPEAEAHLARIRSYANSSDPAGLSQLLDRVEQAAPAFLDWRFNDFTSGQEATEAYISTGANAFDSSMGDFRNEVLRSVANRLDSMLTAIDRVR